MKKMLLTTTLCVALAGVGTVFAADSSPFGKYGDFDKVSLNVDRESTQSYAILIDGEVYVPLSDLSKMNKLAYLYDQDRYVAYLFFGGGSTIENSVYSYYDSEVLTKSKRELANEVMEGIPYSVEDYHSGMMRQDIVTLVSLNKAFLTSLDTMDNAVQTKISVNREPNMELVQQAIRFRALPLEIMEDRMDALARELGRQISSRSKRKMEDVIDSIEDAVKYQRKAYEAMEDWLESSKKQDLEDYRDYIKDARESIYDAVEILNGEVLDKPGTKKDSSLLNDVNDWIIKQ